MENQEISKLLWAGTLNMLSSLKANLSKEVGDIKIYDSLFEVFMNRGEKSDIEIAFEIKRIKKLTLILNNTIEALTRLEREKYDETRSTKSD